MSGGARDGESKSQQRGNVNTKFPNDGICGNAFRLLLSRAACFNRSYSHLSVGSVSNHNHTTVEVKDYRTDPAAFQSQASYDQHSAARINRLVRKHNSATQTLISV
jgi:hypothetical protein